MALVQDGGRQATAAPAGAPLAIFGYGSLVWRPDLPHTEAHDGYIVGWVRRFYQGSPDHRGTPERPGRVATLLRAADEKESPLDLDFDEAKEEL